MRSRHPGLTRDAYERQLASHVLQYLEGNHCGAGYGASVIALAERLEMTQREVRAAVERLRRDGVPICATPGTGYYYATDAEEVERCAAFLYARAMTSLQQVSRLRRVALPELLGQLSLDLSEAHKP